MEIEGECLLYCADKQSFEMSCIIRCVMFRIRIGCRFTPATDTFSSPPLEGKPHFLIEKYTC